MRIELMNLFITNEVLYHLSYISIVPNYNSAFRRGFQDLFAYFFIFLFFFLTYADQKPGDHTRIVFHLPDLYRL